MCCCAFLLNSGSALIERMCERFFRSWLHFLSLPLTSPCLREKLDTRRSRWLWVSSRPAMVAVERCGSLVGPMPSRFRWLTVQLWPGLKEERQKKPLVLCAHPYFSVLFPPSFVESQMAQVDRLKILERGVLSSSLLCCGSFVVVFTFFQVRI